MFQNVMKRAKHLILHHCHLAALQQKIFRLFAGNLICLLGLHDYREIGGFLGQTNDSLFLQARLERRVKL